MLAENERVIAIEFEVHSRKFRLTTALPPHVSSLPEMNVRSRI